MRTLVAFLEEPSAAALLKGLLPRTGEFPSWRFGGDGFGGWRWKWRMKLIGSQRDQEFVFTKEC